MAAKGNSELGFLVVSALSNGQGVTLALLPKSFVVWLQSAKAEHILLCSASANLQSLSSY